MLSKKQREILKNIFNHYAVSAYDRQSSFQSKSSHQRKITFSELRKMLFTMQIQIQSYPLFVQFKKLSQRGCLKFVQFQRLLLLLSQHLLRYTNSLQTPERYLIKMFSLDQKFGWYSKAKLDIKLFPGVRPPSRPKKLMIRHIIKKQSAVMRVKSLGEQSIRDSNGLVRLIQKQEKTESDFYLRRMNKKYDFNEFL